MSEEQNLNLSAELDAEEHQLDAELQAEEEAPAASEILSQTQPQVDAGPSKAEQEYCELIAGVITPVAALIAPNWQIQPQEIAVFAEATGKLAAHYYPEGLQMDGPAGLWIGAITTTIAIALPRKDLPLRAPVAPEQSHGEIAA